MLSLSDAMISKIVDDPAYRSKPTEESGLSASMVCVIRPGPNQGYTMGFKHVFYLKASLTAVVALIGIA
ncbi:uncharacterized protein BT62DRAFT_740785 [Guyanagaster necrorhizus]|uniref:Uncharacterized protein n=1 Tax=Guyanagaster necrorhizus TaxID=856835 RepID=A0A9P7VF82_9AGAR|nr:uncharacterized protein BT62DRAFT_740785 [Guyanagaster necrorhizus MCA 3950]KAG7439305.1 hypothetical protein BT62DRAFT_740785 [Guyanagaster necrorhizus MCA 3950]